MTGWKTKINKELGIVVFLSKTVSQREKRISLKTFSANPYFMKMIVSIMLYTSHFDFYLLVISLEILSLSLSSYIKKSSVICSVTYVWVKVLSEPGERAEMHTLVLSSKTVTLQEDNANFIVHEWSGTLIDADLPDKSLKLRLQLNKLQNSYF